MTYWMNGPHGMMFNHSMMMGGPSSYSFWTWGGSFRCGGSYLGPGPGAMDLWVNATWGLI